MNESNKMYAIGILLRNNANIFRFHYRSKTSGQSMFEGLVELRKQWEKGQVTSTRPHSWTYELNDDFGAQVLLDVSEIAVCQFDCIQDQNEAQIELKLIEARTNLRLKRRYQADPGIKALEKLDMGQAAPSILQPGG